MSSITSIIESLSSVPSKTLNLGDGTYLEYRSYYLPAARNTDAGEKRDDFPADLLDLWNVASKVAIYEDISYGQWGLLIYGESWSLQETELYQGIYQDSLNSQNLIFGEFLGDSEKAIISLDAADYGAIKIMQPLDRREDWPVVASSLKEFLEKLLEARGQKYWL